MLEKSPVQSSGIENFLDKFASNYISNYKTSNGPRKETFFESLVKFTSWNLCFYSSSTRHILADFHIWVTEWY